MLRFQTLATLTTEQGASDDDDDQFAAYLTQPERDELSSHIDQILDALAAHKRIHAWIERADADAFLQRLAGIPTSDRHLSKQPDLATEAEAAVRELQRQLGR